MHPKTFVTSDHHFGSWKGLSCFRVFSKDQEEDAIAKWNSLISDNDLVYYLGDFSDSNAIGVLEYRKQLHGQIVLVKGNHDTLPDDFYKVVFKDVMLEARIGDVVMHHCPDLSVKKQIFGHVHRDGKLDKSLEDAGFCACASLNNGWPILLEDALKKKMS